MTDITLKKANQKIESVKKKAKSPVATTKAILTSKKNTNKKRNHLQRLKKRRSN